MSPLNISSLEGALKSLIEGEIASREIKVKAHDTEEGGVTDEAPQVIVGLSAGLLPKSASCVAVLVTEGQSEVPGVYLPEVWLIAVSPALLEAITEIDNRDLYEKISEIFQDRPRKLPAESSEDFAARVQAWEDWREEVSGAIKDATGYVSTGWETNQVGYVRENDTWQHRVTFFLSCVHPSFVEN
ncbi:MAG: hypothetical protein AB7I98_03870 [Verrucomicrobiales bacterium]